MVHRREGGGYFVDYYQLLLKSLDYCSRVESGERARLFWGTSPLIIIQTKLKKTDSIIVTPIRMVHRREGGGSLFKFVQKPIQSSSLLYEWCIAVKADAVYCVNVVKKREKPLFSMLDASASPRMRPYFKFGKRATNSIIVTPIRMVHRREGGGGLLADIFKIWIFKEELKRSIQSSSLL